MNIGRKIISTLHPIIYRGIKWYYGKPRTISLKGIELKLYPTVFHPYLYLSTLTFLEYILTLEIEYEQILELGAGSGLISLHLAKYRKSKVVASDINPNAIKGLVENATSNKVNIKVIQSDLFEKIPFLNFKFILVNPPYTPKHPKTIDEHAFYCGENLEYYDRFFQQAMPRIKNGAVLLMIISEIAPKEAIVQLAKKHQLKMTVVHTAKNQSEQFSIYKIN